ncbi:hypothetical protein [Janthinobacterium sp. DSP2-3-3]|uniref:hypothetical protein n=1 Tax=Janthinobacterium sp. DSP2-3-3 TaxID=2804596 RepID=UPI003CF3688D
MLLALDRMVGGAPQPISPITRSTGSTMADDSSIRLFNVIDDFSREGPGVKVDFSLPSENVIRPSTGSSNEAVSSGIFAAIIALSTSEP